MSYFCLCVGKRIRDFSQIRKDQKSDEKERTVHRSSVATTDARDLRMRSVSRYDDRDQDGQRGGGFRSSQERRRSYMVGNSGTRRETDASSLVLKRRSRGKIKRHVR